MIICSDDLLCHKSVIKTILDMPAKVSSIVIINVQPIVMASAYISIHTLNNGFVRNLYSLDISEV
ncbi:hypothetical protein ccbrp13_20890 [Ktedonobacteria bacterium brp13]|nr:hypothetical protein ccbrp13_20890 [Ktedonobacteria bacterium brp13]